jgi:hypothetical protein
MRIKGIKRYKVRAKSYVWCDSHGEIHQAKVDYYEDDDNCVPDNWRKVYVESTDESEDFG